jgi:toxin ParE1/3/4
MAYRLAKRAEADLEDIAYYIAKESGSLETARRVIESITDRFHLLGANPYAGRARDDDLGPGRRSFPADRYIIVCRVSGRDVLILRVAHSRRDIEAYSAIERGKG